MRRHGVIVAARHSGQWSPALRLLADRGRRTARRPAAVAGALTGRVVRPRAYAIWPSVAHPQFAVDVAHPASATWLRETFEPEARGGRFPGPATWSALRARGLLWGPPSRLVVEALAGADQAAEGVRLGLYSPTGQSNSKITCFAFAPSRRVPELVVKAMPDRRFADRLRHETELVETIRRRLPTGGDATAALPLKPVLAATMAGDYVVVQPVDPLAAATGNVSERARALGWLRAFHAGTERARAPWSGADTEHELDAVRYAWRRARPGAAEEVIARAHTRLREVEGLAVPRCAVHGDFWHGNLAQCGRLLRVYDWEWAREEGPPFFDLWTWELGPLRRRAELGEGGLRTGVAGALERVDAALQERGVDPRFALATLAPALGELTFRVRRATGVAGGAEAESALLMDAVADLIGSA
jgi:hypothetical protein